MEEFEHELGIGRFGKGGGDNDIMRFAKFINFMKQPRSIDDDADFEVKGLPDEPENWSFQGIEAGDRRDSISNRWRRHVDGNPGRVYDRKEGKWIDEPDPLAALGVKPRPKPTLHKKAPAPAK